MFDKDGQPVGMRQLDVQEVDIVCDNSGNIAWKLCVSPVRSSSIAQVHRSTLCVLCGIAICGEGRDPCAGDRHGVPILGAELGPF
jgi:hypothetical protein